MFGYYLGENPIEVIVDKFFLLDFPLNNNETSVYYVVKRVTRGREGVKNDEKSSDVICECHLRKTNRFFHFFKYFKYLGFFSNENGESKYLVELS